MGPGNEESLIMPYKSWPVFRYLGQAPPSLGFWGGGWRQAALPAGARGSFCPVSLQGWASVLPLYREEIVNPPVAQLREDT